MPSNCLWRAQGRQLSCVVTGPFCVGGIKQLFGVGTEFVTVHSSMRRRQETKVASHLVKLAHSIPQNLKESEHARQHQAGHFTIDCWLE